MTCHQQQIFTLLPATGVNCLRLSNQPLCSVQASDQVDVMCVQMRELLTYSTSAPPFRGRRLLFLSVMRISCYEVRFFEFMHRFQSGDTLNWVILKITLLVELVQFKCETFNFCRYVSLSKQ